MSKSRLEKFLYALYSLESSDLPNPLSRIEKLYKCWVTGGEAPTFEPLSRVEKYLMAILGVYDVDSLPNPLSRVEVLLYKLATGDDNLDDVKSFLSEHEELLAEIIRNGGNIDIEYVLYTLSTEHNTLYNTAEKPVKSAILKGNTKIYDNLNNEVDVINCPKTIFGYYLNVSTGEPVTSASSYITEYFIECPSVKFKIHGDNRYKRIAFYDENKTFIKGQDWSATSNSEQSVSSIPSNAKYIKISFSISVADTDEYTPSNKIYLLDSYGENLYLTHLKSVKMPVLTSTGKNLFNVRTAKKGYTLSSDDGLEIEKSKRYISDFIYVKGLTHLAITNPERTQNIWGYDEDKQPIIKITDDGINGNFVISIPSNITYVRMPLATRDQDVITDEIIQNNPVQVEAGEQFSSYEPYKTNILTVNEEVTLRSNGDVYDELNLLTGRLTQRIDENNEALSQEVVKTVDLSVVDQDGNDTELTTFNDITHVTLSSEGLIPGAELEVATKNEEVLNTLSLEMDDISTTQNDLQETSNGQSENIDSTMLATTEIYEQLL